jgi:Fur family ferric uptake transcriptional regulator
VGMKTQDKLLKIFKSHHLPLSEAQLRSKVMVNKTTIYRALDRMLAENLIKAVDFGDGKKRFELNSLQHHHHLICQSCERVEDVHVSDDVSGIEKQISKQKKFKIINHSLEFFGLCAQCVSK